MLLRLTINNVVLIDQLRIDFDPGLCTFTGETGAGKSILLDSLGLALGSRAESRLVRHGCDKAIVTAEFDLHGTNEKSAPASNDDRKPHPVYHILNDADIIIEPSETLILKRVLNVDGKSRAFINDQPISIGLLKTIGEELVEIHGQFDTGRLLDSSTHRAFLDEYAGIDSTVTTLWQVWREALQTLDNMQNAARQARADEEYLRTSLEDLDALEPVEGEEDILAAQREALMHREKILKAFDETYNLLGGNNDPVAQAASLLEKVADKSAEADEAVKALDRAASEIAEALSIVRSASSDLRYGDHDSSSVDDRLFALRAQARKHQCSVNDLAAKRDQIARQLAMIEHGEENLAAQMKLVQEARQKFIERAQTESKKRIQAAKTLNELVQKELIPLKLDKAKFITSIEQVAEDKWGPHGIDQVRFLVSTNPGTPPDALNKVASGGELARFMLALKVVTAQTSAVQTMIFDEVDAGVGGATAAAVGERLARLAQNNKQVMVVTHAPQVAARAGTHYIVSKGGTDVINTDIVRLNDTAARREEIARMLAGSQITEEARSAAESLLQNKG